MAASESRLHGQGDSGIVHFDAQNGDSVIATTASAFPASGVGTLRRRCLHPSLHPRQRRRFHRHPIPRSRRAMACCRRCRRTGTNRSDGVRGDRSSVSLMPRRRLRRRAASSSAMPCLPPIRHGWCIVMFPGRPEGRPSSVSRGASVDRATPE